MSSKNENTNKAIELLRDNPVFWSRLGFCYDPPLKNNEGKPLVFTEDLDKYAKYHRDFTKSGVDIHTSILHSGWVGIDTYDYSLTDRVLEAVFHDNPNIWYIPRIKLNIPLDWAYENPEELFVYYEGPREKEEIRKLVGTLKQDYLGYESAEGYYRAGDYVDKRPNVGGLIARQSFSSKKWLEDAGEALKKLLDRLENGKYGSRILGYHIAYGASGESVVWGRASNRYGDYGIVNAKEFYNWGIEKYETLGKLRDVWQQPDLISDNVIIPSPSDRTGNIESLEAFMRGSKKDIISIDYDKFTSDINANAVEYFAKIAKEYSNNKLVGAFYGYFIHVDNSAYTGHLALEKLLNSPYIDFFAAPKSYYRCMAGEPGGELCPAQSVNRKKLWVDELDNRTFLADEDVAEWVSSSADDTNTVFWREFSKNISHNSGFWWMDLGGGWFDSPVIMDDISAMVQANDLLRKVEHKSISDVLIVIDEDCINYMNTSSDLRKGFMEDFMYEAQMSGVIIDTYRLKDILEIDLSAYKMIVFAYTFKIADNLWHEIMQKISQNVIIMFNYASGVWNNNCFENSNVKKVTGFNISSCNENEEKYDFPQIEIAHDESINVLDRSASGIIKIAQKERAGGGINILNTKPYLSAEEFREIAKNAGCHLYAPVGCTLYGDNRFIGVFPKDKIHGNLVLKESGSYKEVISGEVYKDVLKIPLELKEKSTRIFLKI